MALTRIHVKCLVEGQGLWEDSAVVFFGKLLKFEHLHHLINAGEVSMIRGFESCLLIYLKLVSPKIFHLRHSAPGMESGRNMS